MAHKPKIYLAGPLGFSEAGQDFYYRRLVPTIREAGYEVLDPWKLTDQKRIDRVNAMPPGAEKKEASRRLNMIIGRNNAEAIRESNGLVAVLDGPDVDSGTAGEIGLAYGLKKPILGYRGDFRLASENEGSIVNLQIEYFIRASRGTIVTAVAQIPEELKKMLRRSRR